MLGCKDAWVQLPHKPQKSSKIESWTNLKQWSSPGCIALSRDHPKPSIKICQQQWLCRNEGKSTFLILGPNRLRGKWQKFGTGSDKKTWGLALLSLLGGLRNTKMEPLMPFSLASEMKGSSGKNSGISGLNIYERYHRKNVCCLDGLDSSCYVWNVCGFQDLSFKSWWR